MRIASAAPPLLVAVTLLAAAVVAAPSEAAVMRLPSLPSQPLQRYSHWVERNDNGMIYDTTGKATDLDHAVAAGAKILKYKDGSYVHAIHKQYPSTCGPGSLAMVLKQLGLTDPPGPRLMRPTDVDLTSAMSQVDVGYPGSPEDILWMHLHRKRLTPGNATWNDGHEAMDPLYFMSESGFADTRSSGESKSRLAEGTNMDYLIRSDIPRWLWRHPGAGLSWSSSSTGLPGIMNYLLSGGRSDPWRDAMPLPFNGNSDAEVVAYRRIVKAFIDHNIALVCGVEDGHHFNALIGYKGAVSPATAPFYIYTADPLDGWGRREFRQPLRWRRISLVAGNLRSGNKLLVGIIAWNQHAEGGADVRFRPSKWGYQVDRENGNNWLCGTSRRPAPSDPLSDPLAAPLLRPVP